MIYKIEPVAQNPIGKSMTKQQLIQYLRGEGIPCATAPGHELIEIFGTKPEMLKRALDKLSEHTKLIFRIDETTTGLVVSISEPTPEPMTITQELAKYLKSNKQSFTIIGDLDDGGEYILQSPQTNWAQFFQFVRFFLQSRNYTWRTTSWGAVKVLDPIPHAPTVKRTSELIPLLTEISRKYKAAVGDSNLPVVRLSINAFTIAGLASAIELCNKHRFVVVNAVENSDGKSVELSLKKG